MTIRIERVTERSRLAEIAGDWEELNIQSPQGTFFSSHGWLMNWCAWYLDECAQLYVLLAWSGDKLQAVAPFVICREPGGFNWLYLLGTGEPEPSEVATEYADIIARVDAWPEVQPVMADTLSSDREAWDGARLLNVKADCLVWPLLTSVLGSALMSGRRQTGRQYSVSLRNYPTPQRYLDSLSSASFRNKLEVCQRRMQRAGGRFRWVTAKDADFNRCFDTLRQLHDLRWSGRGRCSLFDDPSFAGFHRDMIECPVTRDAVVFGLLELEHEPVAALYLFEYAGRCHFYQSGVNVDAKPNISPGILAHYLALAACVDRGLDCYDFMKGGSTRSYKADFCDPGVGLYDCRLLRPSALPLARYAAMRIGEGMTKARERVLGTGTTRATSTA